MDETSSTCRHTDVQVFDTLHCCLSCGELVTESASPAVPALPFEYKPLDCGDEQRIRLVHVHPGQRQDQIVCDLVHVNLAAVPVYEAVSYTWATTSGDASPSQSIICQGKELAITKNCEAALRCLRRQYRPRVLWIDAICINQKSMTERSHQVRLMDAVYSNASQVLLYLGFRNPTMIAKFLGHLDERSRGVITGNLKFQKSLVVDFLQHPYFNRIWVLQEISLAKLVVLCTDRQTIHWDARTVRQLMFLYERLNLDPPGALRWLPATQRDEHDCLDLLHRGRRCMATDPRDKVFALYGFLPLSFREALPINYAVGTEEVYWNIALHLISTTNRLDVLKHVSPYQPLDLDDMPSWVPDWAIRQSIDMQLPKFTGAQIKRFAAFGFSPKSMSSSSNAEVQATAAHTTNANHQTQLSSLHDFVIWYRDQKFDHHHQTLAILYGMSFSMIPCLRVRAYLLDSITTPGWGDPYSVYSQHASTPFLYSSACRSCGELSAETHRDYHWRQPTGVGDGTFILSGGQVNFKTQQSMGFLSYSPLSRHDPSQPREVRSVEPGDTIWAIEGLDVPVVLRRKIEAGEAHYIFIGNCYFHGEGPEHQCPACGASTEPWLMEYATIDIW